MRRGGYNQDGFSERSKLILRHSSCFETATAWASEAYKGFSRSATCDEQEYHGSMGDSVRGSHNPPLRICESRIEPLLGNFHHTHVQQRQADQKYH